MIFESHLIGIGKPYHGEVVHINPVFDMTAHFHAMNAVSWSLLGQTEAATAISRFTDSICW
ncbi:hypothetical protein MY008_47790 [Escherichia coli]|nr:hypothetical protein MY008_47790 [Escherichia coli]